MTEVDMQQSRLRVFQDAQQVSRLIPRNVPRDIAQLSIPNSAEKLSGRPRHYRHWLKGKLVGVFTLLRDHDRPDALQGCDLPVDVEHLRLEECRAVRRDHRTLIPLVHLHNNVIATG